MSILQNLPGASIGSINSDDILPLRDPQTGRDYHVTVGALNQSFGAKSTISTLRAAASAAANNTPSLLAPHGPAPSWAAATSYRQGAVVRGIGAGNTDNLFVQVEGGSQTSGAGPGPVGAVTAGITTDNTCRWLYIGKTTAVGTKPAWSTVTPAVATDVMNGYLAKVLTANFAALGLTRQFNNNINDRIARLTGGIVIDDGGTGVRVRGPNGGTLAAPAYNTSGDFWCLHIKTDCRKWLAFQPITGVPQQQFFIEVNGQRLTEGQLTNDAAFVGGNSLMLDLSSFPAGTKDVKFYSLNSVREWILRLWVGADENIWTPTAGNNLRMAFEGDSITQGSGTADKLTTNRTERLVSALLGVDNYYNNAVGGTGVLSNNNGNSTTYIQRLSDIVAFAPDVLVVGGFHNDADKGGSSAARQAAVLAYLQAVRAALPACVVFVVGVQMLANESLVTGANSMFDMENTAKAAFDEWNDDNSAFIRTITNSYKFPGSTSNNSWFYQASGAAPFGDSHPTARYYPAYASFIAEQISLFLR